MKTRQEDQLAKKDSRLQKIIETLANLKIIKLQVGQIFFFMCPSPTVLYIVPNIY